MNLFESAQRTPTVDLQEVKQKLSNAKIFACDLETTGLSLEEDRITIVALAYEKDDGQVEGWAIEVTDYPIEVIRKELYDIFHDKEKICVFHNANFDIKFLNKYGIHLDNKLADTMIMAWLYDEDRVRHRGYGLKHCVLKHLNYKMSSYDDARSLFGDFEDYAADDAVQTLRLYRFFEKELMKQSLMDWFWKAEMPIAKILIEVETRGVCLDKNQLKILKKEAWETLEKIEADIFDCVGYKFDVGSPKQWAKVLFDELRIGSRDDGTNEFSHRGKSGEWSTSNAVLEAIKRSGSACNAQNHNKCGHEIAKKLLDFREINTRQNVFIKPLLERCIENPIIHPKFIQVGTVSGRFASKDPNYQNLPRKGGIRQSFIARPEHKIIRADYCVTGDTRIETQRGTLKITDVHPGDGVILEDGSTAVVKEVIDRGKLPVVELTTEHGYTLRATKLHRIRVIDANGDYVWRRIGELQETDYVAIQPGMGVGLPLQTLPKVKYTHKNNKKFDVPEVLTEEVAEFFGYLCGDGCSDLAERQNGSTYIGSVHNKKDADFIEWAVDKYQKLFPGAHLQTYVYPEKEAVEFKISSKPLLLWAKKIGISKQSVPEIIKCAPLNCVQAFLRGFFETDGSIGKKSNGQRISASSSRKNLIDEIQLLLLKVGIPSATRLVKTNLNGKVYDGWHVIIPTAYAQLFAERIGFISNRKKEELEVYLSYTNRCPSIGGMPNQKQKVKDLKLSGEVRRLLNNTSSLARPISRKLAQQIKEVDKNVYTKLELFRIAEFNTLFEKVESIKEVGSEDVYDLSVPGPMTYISNGFVSHNSQAELRLMAHMSGDPIMIDIYRNNGDIHQVTAEACQITRQAAKAVNFGLIYRMSAARLQAQLALQGIEIPIEEAYKYVKRYFRNYKKVREYHKRVEQIVMKRLDENGEFGWVRTLGGRYRRLDRNYLTMKETAFTAITQAINTTIQGGVSDLIKIAMVDCQNVFRKNGWLDPEKGIWDAYLQGQVHDELFAECKEEIAAEAAEVITYCMENAGRKYSIKVPMTAEAAIVDNLSKG